MESTDKEVQEKAEIIYTHKFYFLLAAALDPFGKYLVSHMQNHEKIQH